MSTPRLSGLATLESSLQALATSLPALVSPGLAEALDPVSRAVATEAPRDTGALAGSVAVIGRAPHGMHASAEVRVARRYAAAVDLGTADRDADDFLQRGFDETAERAADDAANEAVKAIMRALR